MTPPNQDATLLSLIKNALRRTSRNARDALYSRDWKAREEAEKEIAENILRNLTAAHTIERKPGTDILPSHNSP